MEEHERERHEDRPGVGEGIRTGLGMLYALKDAVEETVQDLVKRGDVGADRARQAMQDAWRRAQTRFESAREDFDLVPRRDFERLEAEVAALRRRVEQLEGGAPGPGEDTGGIIVGPE